MKFKITLDKPVCSAGGDQRYLWLRLEAPRRATKVERPPLDLALVLDRSGSMGGDKIVLARTAAKAAVQVLRETDRCAVVGFDDQVTVAAPAANVDATHRSRLLSALDALDARGSTDLFGGWMTGAEQVCGTGPDRVRRVLQLTDGLANVGVTVPDDITKHVGELRARGVGTTTFGVGRDFDEVLLSGMAEAGGGHFYYIENAAQIPDYLASELGELLTVIARSVRLRVRASAGVSVHCVNDLPMTAGWTEIGDLSEGAIVDLLFALDIPANQAGPVALDVDVAWTDADSHAEQAAAEQATLTVVPAPEAAAQPLDADAAALVVRTRAAAARRNAVGWNRSGDYAAARKAIDDEIAELEPFAAAAPESADDLAKLREEAQEVAFAMDSPSRKRMEYASYMARSSRSDPGERRA